MVFGGLKKALGLDPASVEARKNAEAEFKRQLDAQTDATINKIHRETDAVMAQTQADHNAEMQERHEQACAEVRQEMQNDFDKSTQEIEKILFELESDERLTKMKAKSEDAGFVSEIQNRWEKRYNNELKQEKKRAARRLDDQVNFFEKRGLIKLSSARIFGEVPADIETDFDDKLQQLRKLASAKKQELGIEEEIVD